MKPLHVVLFYCVNCVDTAALRLGCRDLDKDTVSTISLPCSGKVTIPYLIKAFENGADGVFVLTCTKQTCRFLEGSSRAEKRVRAVDDLLVESGLAPGRISVVQVPEPEAVGEIIPDLVRRIRDVTTRAAQAA